MKVSMQNESRAEGYSHFCEQDVTWSFNSVSHETFIQKHNKSLSRLEYVGEGGGGGGLAKDNWLQVVFFLC